MAHPRNVFSRWQEKPETDFTPFERGAIRSSIKSYFVSGAHFRCLDACWKWLREFAELKWLG